MFGGVDATGCICLEYAFHLISNVAEELQLLFFGPLRVGRVIERPMVTVHLSRKSWADLIGVSANGNHGFHTDGHEFVEVF